MYNLKLFCMKGKQIKNQLCLIGFDFRFQNIWNSLVLSHRIYTTFLEME